jgi:hypothetical protein
MSGRISGFGAQTYKRPRKTKGKWTTQELLDRFDYRDKYDKTFDVYGTKPIPKVKKKASLKQMSTTLRARRKGKLRQKTWKIEAWTQRRLGRKLRSSFVSKLSWNSATGTVNVLLSGKKYSYLNVEEAIFNAWEDGGATCRTSDDGKKKLWWIGKTPSLGAFFNTYISQPIKGSRKRNDRYTMITGWVD